MPIALSLHRLGAIFLIVIRFLLAALICLQIGALSTPATAAQASRATYSGVVIRVVDGDTVWVSIGATQPPLKVRLQGVDAPEICQAGGLQARDALSGRVLGQRVTIASRAHDDFGRTVGTVYLQGQDINRWLVASGHAWVYTFRQKKGPYAEEFAQAQAARRGLFKDAAADEPRAFRKSRGSCYGLNNRSSSYKKTSSF